MGLRDCFLGCLWMSLGIICPPCCVGCNFQPQKNGCLGANLSNHGGLNTSSQQQQGNPVDHHTALQGGPFILPHGDFFSGAPQGPRP